MNKVFKVIWNHATQTWVAVSEFSKAKGKTKSKTLTTISLAVGSVLVGSQASAAVYVNNQEVTKHGTKTAIVIATEKSNDVASMINATTNSMDNFIRIGQAGAPVVRDGSIVIGFQINDQSTGVAGDTVIGNYAQIGGGGADSLSTSVGYHTQVAGPSVAMGVGARSDILDSSGWLAVHNGGVAIGSFALQGGNRNGGTVVGGLATGDYHFSTTIGAQAGAIGLIDNRAINKHHGFAVNEAGDPAPINGRIGMTSIGYQAAARGTGATAIGQGATTGITGTTNGIAATALGYHARAFKNNSLALGRDAIAGGLTTDELTALDAELTKLNGLLATAEQEKTAATDALRANPTAENKFAVASAEAAKKRIELAISRATEDKKYAANASANTEAAIAIGYSAKANHANTMAIGRATAAYASGSLALGRAAGVTGVNASTSMAIGDAALISGDSAVDSIAVGHSANIKQNSSNAIAIGKSASVVGDINGSSGSIAIGHNTAAGNIKASWGKNSTRELGYLAAQNATAVGTDSIAGGNNATAFGYKNVINAPNSGALGFNNTVGNYSNPTYNNNVASANYNGTDSFVVGANNNVTANNTVVFGNNVTVNSQGTNRTGAVVLGDNSTVPTDVKAVNSAKIGKENGKKLVYSGFAGNLGGAETNGEPQKAAADKQGRFVSVGNETSPRQVKFVAAGEISSTSTDAINGSQLYAFSGVVNNLATSAATIIGGGATLNQNGTLENFSQPLNTTGLAGAAYTKPTTAANNIATAITNLNDYVNAGWKIAQGDDTAAKARISPNEQVNFKANGLATVSVEANGTGGADVTYSVQKGTFDTTTNGTVKANPTKGVVTNTDVATAVNNSGWNTTTTGGTNVTVNPGDQVNYVNGKGTNANVTTAKDANGKDVVSVSYNVNQTTGSVNTNGTVSVVDGNSFLNASAVANLVNNAAFNVTTAKVDAFVTNQEGKADAVVKAGGNITYTAGKNIAIKQAGTNFTFSTTKDVTFENATVNQTLTVGNGTNATNFTSTAEGLKVSTSTGDKQAIVNVKSTLPGTADSKEVVTGTERTLPTLTDAQKATAATVDDVLNAGWNLRGQKAANGAVEAVDFVKPYDTVVFKSGNNATTDVITTTDADNKVSTVTITAKAEPVKTSSLTTTVNNNGTISVATGEAGTNLVNATTVANAINESGWNTNVTNATTGLPETKVVTPGTQVDYVNGNGTTANVLLKDGKVAVSYNVNQTTGSVNPNGTVSVADNKSFLNASTVANLVNNAAFNVTTAKVDAFVTNQEGKANATVKAGGNITYTAGKNIAIKQAGTNFTFSTTKDVVFNNAQVNSTLTIGNGTATSPKVNIQSTTKGLDMGNAVLTNVSSGITPYAAGTTPVTTAKSGLADLANSTQTNVVTVADAAKLGWVVSTDKTTTDATTGTADGNVYAANVTTANEVKFVGKGYATVSGATDSNGVRTITVSVGNVGAGKINADGSVTETKAGLLTAEEGTKLINGAGWLTNVTNATTGLTETKVVTPGTQVNYVDGNGTTANVIKNTVGGKEVVSVSYDVKAGANTIAFNKDGDELVKVGDKYYKVADVVDGKPTNNAVAVETADIATADNRTPYENALNGLVNLTSSVQSNAMTVADAARMGWVVSTSANDYSANVTNTKEVNFVGLGAVDVSGSNVDEIRNINVSVDLPVDYTETTITENGQEVDVVKLSDGKWYKVSDLNDQGEPKDDAVAVDTKVTPISKKGAVLSDASSSLNNNPYKAKEYTYDDVNQTVTPKTYAELLAADPNFNKDEIKEGTNGVKLNNVGWAEAPDQAVNLDQLNQTVYKSGFYVKQNGVDTKGTNSAEDSATEKVTPEDVVNFVNGKNTVLKATTTRNAQTGQDTTNVTVDVDLPVVYTDAEGAKVVKVGDKYYYAEDVENGKLKNGVDADNDAVTNVVASMNNVASDDDTAGNNVVLRNVAEGTKTLAFDTEGNPLVEIDGKYYKLNEDGKADTTTVITPATSEQLKQLDDKYLANFTSAVTGLADLDHSDQSNALTVADAQKLGWVVSAGDYAANVTNANEVRFNGSNGISVTGETDKNTGVRNINVSIAKGKVDGNTTTGVATGDTNYVTGDQVANAINNSGWKTTATKVVDEAGNEIVDANKATAVNPGDSVNYVDGNSTKANVVVTKAADGKETVNVSYDLVTEDHLTPVANDAKSVTKPTNIDAKGKDAATVNDVLNAGWNLQANDEAVDAVTHGNNVNFTSKDGSVKITAKSDGSTSSLDFAVNATSIVNQVAGTISYNKDGKATTNGDGKRIATVGDVANTINNTGWLTNVTDAKGNVTTKVVTPNTQVNYVNGDGTKANVVANSTTGGLDVTFNVKSANPETLTVDGNGVKVNTGSITEATDVAGDANRGKVTVAAGEGNKVATVQNVANAINSASWTVKVADTQEEITTSTANDEGSSVRAGNEITHVAGKNLKVKRDGRNVTYALANDVSVNTVTAQNSIKVGAGNAATTVTTSSAQDGVTEVKLADAAGKATRITNVAAGVKDTDAVNVSQLRNSNAQINQNIAHLNNKVNRMGKDLRAGIAGSNAAAGLPQVYIPGKSMVAAAAGTFKGQSAVAVGYSRASDNGKVILKLQGNANTRGDVGGSVGVGYQW